MIGYVIAGYAILPTAFNLYVGNHKRKKTNKIIAKKLEEKGYIIDDRFKNILVDKIMRFICKEKNVAYTETNYYNDLSDLCWAPFVRWFQCVDNIKYLTGDYSGSNGIYAVLEDSIEDDKIIKFLIENELVKEDKEKIQFLKDRDDALEELMKKYDETNSENLNKNIQDSTEDIVFSKKDSLMELNEKLAQLQQLINEKEKEDSKDIKSYTYESKKE